MMLSLGIITFCLLAEGVCELKYTRETMPGAEYYDGKKLNVPVSHKTGKAIVERWARQSISTILSSIANERLVFISQSEHLNEFHRNQLFKCSNRAENLQEHAKCVVDAIDAKSQQTTSSNLIARRLNKLNKLKSKSWKASVLGSFLDTYSSEDDSENAVTDQDQRRQGRIKRNVRKRTKYSLISERDQLSSLGIVGKFFSRAAKLLKNKDADQSWGTLTSEVEGIQRNYKATNIFERTLLDRFESIGKLSTQLMKRKNAKKKRKETLQKLGIPEDAFDVSASHEKDNQERVQAVRLLREAIKLAMVVSGHNYSTIRNKTLRVGSPRFLSIVPEEANDTLSFFSPSLFSLHDQGKASEALLSIPSVVRAFDKDYEEWMNFVLETSGVFDIIKLIKEKGLGKIRLHLENLPRGIDDQPMYFTKENLTEMFGNESRRKAEFFESLSKDLTRQQLKDFKRKGFSILTKDQLNTVYGESSPFSDPSSLKKFSSMSHEEVHQRLLSDLRKLAKPVNTEGVLSRRKRQVIQPVRILSPILFAEEYNKYGAGLILSPVLFTSIFFSPTILGPYILSPYMFIPTVFSPRVLSPVIVSPSGFAPFVLSSLVMRPTIMSPQVLNPVILCPLVLTPFIMSPTVLSPLILTPFALCPVVLRPTALRIILLSPYVLSPAWRSPSYLVMVLLSPRAFSPALNSTGTASSVILSPSAFS
ncbi:unnamed protein product [Anisakis simplex]|uniref:Rhoptry neck protein 5 n=1 Tax=Anisakis simplex TaxID=6269 RepID=A0A158PP51_ANISI|nr:unnamed protein product [Anisakis simplex]